MASATVRFRANMPNVDVARLLQGPLIVGNRPGDEGRPCLTSADVKGVPLEWVWFMIKYDQT